MLVKEYLSKFNENQQVTFIKARARKDESTPFYHEEYQTTPVRCINEFQKSPVMNYYILNHKQTPIEWLSGAGWQNRFVRGDFLSLLVISKEDIELLYSPKQAAEMIEYIDKEIEKSDKLKKN
jgi:hypothetical protein